jgi:acetoin utilization deacetylase AcuC-like enzyme
MSGSSLSMPVVWTDRHRLHEPKGEVWLGVWVEGTEVPARGERIRAALAQAHASFIEPNHYDDGPFEAVHDPDFLSFLATAYDDWVAGGYLKEPGQDRVVPYVFPLPQLTPGRAPRKPAAASARTGMFAMDTMTLIGPGTWEAARAVAEAALTAADLVADGASAAYAVCRPPGHHVGRDFYGGSCYLNNAALTAQRLRARAVPLVGIIDLDAHHGNGTQEIFYRRPDVIYGSVHVDPGAGWFPHFVGYDDETGEAEGVGANLNLPLHPGTGNAGWLEAVNRLTGFAADRGVGALVVSLGVDAARDDPESPLQVTVDGYAAAGRLIADLGLPTVFVQEGGYHLDSLGQLVLATLLAFEGERRDER